MALKLLGLDEVWWLVSPQNPLKQSADMAPFAERLAQAMATARRHPHIHASDIEARLGSVYTADTVALLRRRFPRCRFVWLMGADNLTQFACWRRWQQIFLSVPIAVFDRPATARKALAGIAAHRFARARVNAGAARRLAELPPPAWAFLPIRLDPRSSTQFRAERRLAATKEIHSPVTPQAISEITRLPARAPRRREPLDSAALLQRIHAALDDGRAEEVVTIDLAGKTTIADYMVIASGRSSRQVAALSDHLEQALAGRHVAIEGKAQAEWVLVDAGDVIVHIFRPETRTYYNLEKMWGEAFPEIEAAQQ